MSFPKRLSTFRRERGLSQTALADTVGVHVSQLRRYEAGTSQPTLEVLRKMACALHVSGDALLFDEKERDPDDDLKLHFEAISKLGAKEREAIKMILEGLILKHEARELEALSRI
jgi:transcriptional regulator with XRE-family HTH domain